MLHKTRYTWETQTWLMNFGHQGFQPNHVNDLLKQLVCALAISCLSNHLYTRTWVPNTRPTTKKKNDASTLYNIQATSSYTKYSKIESHNKVQTSNWTTCFLKLPWVLNRHSWTCYLGSWATGHTKQTFPRIDDIKWSACTNMTSHLWFDYLLQLSLLTSVQRDSLGIGNWNYC